MSSPPSPPQDGDHHGHGRRRPLDLLDDCWFFSNTLASSNKPPRSSAKDHGRLLRTPSPRPKDKDDDLLLVSGTGSGGADREEQQQVDPEVDDDDLNWSSIYEGVLRSRMAEGGRSALRRAPSMPVPSSSISRPRPPSASRQQQQQPVLSRSRSSVFKDKKWRSSSDLESIEAQGFRNLGFVFDKEEEGVLPGLKSSRSRRPPALVRVQSEARSAAEIKDQLRMWAQAVACNVRQEC